MIDQKNFDGMLNSDDSSEVVPASNHQMAYNMRFRGNGNNTRGENVEGNVLITNDNLPIGTNQCIGSFYDSLKQRIIWFNWNSNSRHGIYQYDVLTKTVSTILLCFTDSTTDILNFDINFPIPSVNIIYTTDIDGDLLCWTDRTNRPKILNILSAENNLYGANWMEEYLDVAKAPPSIPIKAAYENDAAAQVNNMRKQLFIPKYRFIYGDNLKSVWSAWGDMAIPFQYVDPQVDSDATKNSRIGCVVQTGGADVKKIEIAFTQSEGNVWGDFFSVIVLDKAQLTIPDNDVYVWRFYNNEAYVPVDVKESALDFDRVPNKANTQELLNGNVIIYAGIEEGEDPVVPIVSVTTSNQYPTAVNASSILSVTQYGESGFKTGNIKFVVLGNVRELDVYSAVVDVLGTPFTITYTAVVNDTPALVLAGLSTNAVGQGFTQVSISANELVISRTNQVLLKSNLLGVTQTITGDAVLNAGASTITLIAKAAFLSMFKKGTMFYIDPVLNSVNTVLFTTVSAVAVSTNLQITVTSVPLNETAINTVLYFITDVNLSIPAYDEGMKENLGIVYFDEKGKSNGVTTSVNFNATTLFSAYLNLNTLIYKVPEISISINHRPPLWARYYHLVRTQNLTKLKYLYWMTDRTYKDDKYAYISVESIQTYKKINPNSLISYSFASGDRIRFHVLYNADSSPGHPIFFRDYEIYSQVINPEINRIVRNGQFLKIVLPNVDVFFNFGDGATRNYFYYYIELYTPAKSAGENLDTYNEFTQRYAIGNAGTNLAFHQGQLQNQTDDLVTPATFSISKGDAYFRNREINVGNVISYDLLPTTSIEPNYILAQRIKTEILSSSDFLIAPDVPYQQLITTGGLYNNAGWTINVFSPAYLFTAKGEINITAENDTVNQVRFQIGVADASHTLNYFTLGLTNGLLAGQSVSYKFSVPFTMPVTSKIFLHMSSSDFAFRATLTSGNISYVEPSKTFIVGCVDQNFSDFYDSKVNPNGRQWVVNPDEKTTLFGTLLRWGLDYEQNTNINRINRFYPTNFDEVDRAKGNVQRLKSRDRILRVFQNRGVGQYGVYAKFIQSNNDNSNLTTTDEILTKNNINYYAGTFGMGEQYCSLISGKNQDYFVDPVRGYQLRLSNDGLTPISEKYKGQFFIQPLFPPYNNDYIRAAGGKSKILGAYNFFEEEAITVLQSGTNNGDSILPFTFSFNEKRNSYCSFFDFHPEWIGSAEDLIYTWLNGKIYVHNAKGSNYTTFYGVKKYPSITLSFNDKVAITKTFQSLGYEANQLWIADVNGDVITSQPNQQTGLPQISAVRDWNFDIQEGRYRAFLNRDANSLPDPIEALNNGDYLKGTWIKIKLTYKGNNFAFLYLPYVNWSVSQRNF